MPFINVLIKLINSQTAVAALPSFWLWTVYEVVLVDAIPDQMFGLDFCTVFSICVTNFELSTSTDSFFYIYHACLCGAIFCPLFVLFSVLYARICSFLWNRRAVGDGPSAHQQTKHKKKIAVTLLGLVAVFFVCRMPNWIFVILAMSHLVPEMTPAIWMIKSSLVFLSVFNAALNPLLYEPLTKNATGRGRSFHSHRCCCCCSCCDSYDPAASDFRQIPGNAADQLQPAPKPLVSILKTRHAESPAVNTTPALDRVIDPHASQSTNKSEITASTFVLSP